MSSRQALMEFEDFTTYGNLKTQDITDNIAKKKYTIKSYITDGSKALKDIIPHTWVFMASVQDMHWPDNVQVSLYGLTLKGNAKMRWSTTRAELVDDEPRDLEDSLRAFISTYVPTNRDVQYSVACYITKHKKPNNIDVQNYLMHMENMNASTKWVSGAATALNAKDFKLAFFDAMPDAWQDKFEEANLNIMNLSIKEITSYFVIFDKKKDTTKNHNNNKRKQVEDGDDDHQPTTAQGNKKRNRRGNGKGKNNGNKNKKPGNKTSGSESCPICKTNSHVLEDCYFYAKNANSPIVKRGIAAAVAGKKTVPKKNPKESHVADEAMIAIEVPKKAPVSIARWGLKPISRFDECHVGEIDKPVITGDPPSELAVKNKSKHTMSNTPYDDAEITTPLTPVYNVCCSQLLSRLNQTTSLIPRAVNVRVTAVTTKTFGPMTTVENSSVSRKRKLPISINSVNCLLARPTRSIYAMAGQDTMRATTTPTSCSTTITATTKTLRLTSENDDESLFASLPARIFDLVTCDSINSFFIDLDHLYTYISEMPDIHYQKSKIVCSTDTNFLLELDSALSPCTTLLVKSIQGHAFNQSLRALFDTGSDSSHIQQRVLPEEAGSSTMVEPKTIVGMTGTASISQEVELQDMLLPEFSQSRRISDPFKCYVMDNKSVYDIILGRDFLMTVGIDILNSTQEMQWLDNKLPFRDRFSIQDPFDLNTTTLEILSGDMEGLERSSILDAKYEAFDPHAIAESHTHLTPQQRVELGDLLSEFPQLFDGKLRTYPRRKVHIEMKENATPVNRRAYPVPHAHLETLKTELDHLCEIGVLERCGASEWAMPSFIIPKKDGRVRLVSDFRELNKCIKRPVYPLPRIQDVLRKRKNYSFFTKLDVSMQYYTFELDDVSSEYCVISTPFGPYRYKKLPMGVKIASDFAQEAMEESMRDIDEVDCYIDDVGIWDDSWDNHLKTLRKVLQRLQTDGFAINPLKCEFGVKETDWLGYWLTPIGLKPWRKKVDAIIKLEAPTMLTQVRSFIGAVTYYRDMFHRRSHVLTPLTELTKGTGPKKRKIIWTDECQKSFDTMKAIITRDVLIRYPDHNIPFHVYTDASDLQLGSVIIQNNAPVAYFSRKLNSTQKNYSTIEKELLSIVETLKEYRTMLFGCRELNIYTDHKNLTHNKLSSQKVIRWRLFIEEYNPIFHFVKGTDNAIADALSRLPRTERQEFPFPSPGDQSRLKSSHDTPDSIASDPKPDDTNFTHQDTTSSLNNICFKCNSTAPLKNDGRFLESSSPHAFSVLQDDNDMLECLLNFPDMQVNANHPLDYQSIAVEQLLDIELVQKLETNPTKYMKKMVDDDVELIVYKPTAEMPWKICIPNAKLDNTIRWYHMVLNHTGISRLYGTITMHFYNPRLRTRIDEIVKACDACQRFKLTGKGYGKLPPREPPLVPWEEIAVDLIGPWKIQINDRHIVFNALTVIDIATNLAELIRVMSKSAAHVGLQLENAWLSRYPSPVRIIYDQGPEFKGQGFQAVLRNHNIRKRPTTVKNPQANAICERLHQTITNVLRPLCLMHPPQNIDEASLIIDTALQAASYSARTAIHTTMENAPGAIAFSRDMLLNIPLIADLYILQQNRRLLINKQLIKANRKRISHDYRQGEEVLILAYKPDKLDARATGPFRIEQVHANGTVTIRRSAHVTERINIRRLKPYRR